jgi:hypothetical protein
MRHTQLQLWCYFCTFIIRNRDRVFNCNFVLSHDARARLGLGFRTSSSTLSNSRCAIIATPAGVAFLSEVTVDQYLSTLQKLEDARQEVEREVTLQKKLERAVAEVKRQYEGTVHPPSRSSAQLGVRQVASSYFSA